MLSIGSLFLFVVLILVSSPLCLSGGFYSDDVGYVSTSCKKCPNGSFVEFDKAPGKQLQDCKSCPLGKNIVLNRWLRL